MELGVQQGGLWDIKVGDNCHSGYGEGGEKWLEYGFLLRTELIGIDDRWIL